MTVPFPKPFRCRVDGVWTASGNRDGWPTQAWFWLEWGSSTAGQSLPAAVFRFRVVHFDSISSLTAGYWFWISL
jgi:hypothetical protein